MKKEHSSVISGTTLLILQAVEIRPTLLLHPLQHLTRSIPTDMNEFSNPLGVGTSVYIPPIPPTTLDSLSSYYQTLRNMDPCTNCRREKRKVFYLSPFKFRSSARSDASIYSAMQKEAISMGNVRIVGRKMWIACLVASLQGRVERQSRVSF